MLDASLDHTTSLIRSTDCRKQDTVGLLASEHVMHSVSFLVWFNDLDGNSQSS